VALWADGYSPALSLLRRIFPPGLARYLSQATSPAVARQRPLQDPSIPPTVQQMQQQQDQQQVQQRGGWTGGRRGGDDATPLPPVPMLSSAMQQQSSTPPGAHTASAAGGGGADSSLHAPQPIPGIPAPAAGASKGADPFEQPAPRDMPSIPQRAQHAQDGGHLDPHNLDLPTVPLRLLSGMPPQQGEQHAPQNAPLCTILSNRLGLPLMLEHAFLQSCASLCKHITTPHTHAFLRANTLLLHACSSPAAG
jgi:hypothetical protein